MARVLIFLLAVYTLILSPFDILCALSTLERDTVGSASSDVGCVSADP